MDVPTFYRLSGADCGIGQRSCQRGKFLLKTLYVTIELDFTFGEIRLFSICRQNFSCSVDICNLDLDTYLPFFDLCPFRPLPKGE